MSCDGLLGAYHYPHVSRILQENIIRVSVMNLTGKYLKRRCLLGHSSKGVDKNGNKSMV